MKKFRQIKNNIYICEECGKTYTQKWHLSKHINKKHDGCTAYFNKWLKENDEGVCKICGTLIFLKNFKQRNINTCLNKECINKLYKDTNEKVYGVEYPMQNLNIQEKSKQTCITKYGVEYAIQSNEFKINMKKLYGAEYPTQNKEIFEKIQKTAKELKPYNDKIWYQASYELDFLEKYYNKYPDIVRGPSIKYQIKGKNKIYHPDFYIPSLNLIIEIKNKWMFERDKDIIDAKEKATIANGFKYLMIVDKDYSKFIFHK